MNNIVQRVNQLEKQVNRYRFISFVLVAGLFGSLIVGFRDKQLVPSVLQAKSFQVVNDAGNVLAEMTTEKGNGLFTTYTPSGMKLFQVFTSDGGGGGINTFDNNGQVNFKVTRTTDGGGYMALFNSNLKEVFEVGTTTANSGYFRVNDKAGNKLAWLTFTDGGGAYFSLSGRNNQEYIKFSTPDAGGRVGVYNGDNKRITFLGTMDNKDGNLTLFNSLGTVSEALPKQ